jgi:hypothetical protein
MATLVAAVRIWPTDIGDLSELIAGGSGVEQLGANASRGRPRTADGPKAP